MDVAGTAEVKNWVLGFGAKAAVLEPAALRSEIAGELRAASIRYARASEFHGSSNLAAQLLLDERPLREPTRAQEAHVYPTRPFRLGL